MTDKKHNHYFKDVSHLDYIDVYRVLELFQVTDPCLQHAAKKILVAGNRGHKDLDKDVQDIIDSCLRFQEIRKENDKKATPTSGTINPNLTNLCPTPTPTPTPTVLKSPLSPQFTYSNMNCSN